MNLHDNPLRIGGFVPFSTIDYPDALAAVVFCQGCAWRCRYCHNPDLLPTVGTLATPQHQWMDVLSFLQRRKGLLDALVFSGGEPILQDALVGAINQVMELGGYKIGLHTAGCNPERLAQILPCLNWVGLDIKAPAAGYRAITGALGSGTAAWESASLVINSGVAYEMRITLHPALLSPAAISQIVADLQQLGATQIVVQTCRTATVLDPTLQAMSQSLDDYKALFSTSSIRLR